RHHAGRALLVAEYGVPSSRGVSHLDADGNDHGGHDERAMAQIDARLTQDIRDAGAAGGVLFAWLDEWFKHTWVTIDLEVPPERTRLWHNVEDAEQHYGLLGEYAGPSPGTPEPGGEPGAWQALPWVERRDSLVLRLGADPSYLYLALAGGPRFEAARYVVGIDTYRRGLGEMRLPGGGRAGSVGIAVGLLRNALGGAGDARGLVHRPRVRADRSANRLGTLERHRPVVARVMVRYRRDGVFETAPTDGFRFAVAALDRKGGAVVGSLEPERTYAWPTWEVPTWHERLKPAYFAMREVWGSW